MANTSPLSARDLKEILEQIAVPDSLTNHPFLHSWIIAEYLHEYPDAAQFSAEFLIGKAFERELELWSREYRLSEVYRDEWLKIFCLKWYYFQKKPQLAAFQKHQTLKKLGAAIVDAEVLATLVPGKETEAKNLLEAEEYRTFWYSFSTRVEALDPNRASEKLSAALQAFADQIETRRAHKFAQSVQLPIADQVVASDQPAPRNSLATGTIAPSSLTSLPNQLPSALDSYQRILDWQYPAIAGYRSPVCRCIIQGASQEIKGDADVQRFLENPAVLIGGATGIGKTTYLTQVIVPACRELGLAPLFIALPAYFNARDKVGDLPTFLRETIFGHVYTDAEQKDQFTRELAVVIFQQSVIWLLDGFDELTPRERGLLTQELEHLDHFAITTRHVTPEAHRPIDVIVQLTNIDYSHALEHIGPAIHPKPDHGLRNGANGNMRRGECWRRAGG